LLMAASLRGSLAIAYCAARLYRRLLCLRRRRHSSATVALSVLHLSASRLITADVNILSPARPIGLTRCALREGSRWEL
jgi:hypothetical protein